MKLSFPKALAAALVAGSMAVPAAWAGTDTGIGIPAGRDSVVPLTHSVIHRGRTSQEGPLDPWAYSLIHRNRASQKGPLDPWAYSLIHSGQPRGHSLAVAPEVTVSGSSDFQWEDAGVGAGFALGALALTGGGVLAVRRQRSHLRTS